MQSLIDRFETMVREARLSWFTPHTITHDGETSHEWFKGNRCLAVFERQGSVELLMIWGHRIHDDMKGIDDPSDDELLAAWRWLNDG